MNGIRFVLTFKCNRRCSFCYQKSFKHTLSISNLIIFCEKHNDKKLDYITVMGGEIFFLNNYKEYLKIINSYFKNVREKNITTNGDFDFKFAKSLGYLITVSNKDLPDADRINIYYDGKSELKIPKINKNITICSELNGKPIQPPNINDKKPIKIADGRYLYSDKIRYYNHENSYNNDEIILLPSGRETNDFIDVVNYET